MIQFLRELFCCHRWQFMDEWLGHKVKCAKCGKVDWTFIP